MIPAVPEFYRTVQEDRPVFWEITVSVNARKKKFIYDNMLNP